MKAPTPEGPAIFVKAGGRDLIFRKSSAAKRAIPESKIPVAGLCFDVRSAEPCEMSCELLCDENGVRNAQLVELLDEQIVLLDPSNRPHAYPVQSLLR